MNSRKWVFRKESNKIVYLSIFAFSCQTKKKDLIQIKKEDKSSVYLKEYDEYFTYSFDFDNISKSKYIDMLSTNQTKNIGYIGLAVFAIKEHQLKKAQNILNEIKTSVQQKDLKQNAVFVFKEYLSGVIFEKLGMRSEARKVFRSLVENNRHFLYAYIALAVSYLKDKKYDLAYFILSRGLDQNPEKKELFCYLGYVLMYKDEKEQARSYFDRSLTIDPNFGLGYLYRGYLSVLENKTDEAKKDIKEALKLMPNNQNVFLALGESFLLDPKDEFQAESAFRHSLYLNPFSREGRVFLSQFLSETKKSLEEAKRLEQEAVLLER